MQLSPDLIRTHGGPGIRAAKQATETIPIVYATASADPVGDGNIASLTRPGGNLTGLTLYPGEEGAKRIQLLEDAIPGLSSIAILWPQANPLAFRTAASAAESLGVRVVSLQLSNPEQLDVVLASAEAGAVDGLAVTAEPVLTFLAPKIVSWSARQRLPAIDAISTFIEPGGLMVYAANNPENGAAQPVTSIESSTVQIPGTSRLKSQRCLISLSVCSWLNLLAYRSLSPYSIRRA